MSRFTGGWVKLHRSILDKDISCNLILCGIWTHLLVTAVYKNSQILWMGQQRTLVPGQCVFGIKELADKWGISRSVIQKWLHHLHNTHRIVLESCSRGTVVTICNWELYQLSDEEACSPRVNGVLTACSPRVNGEALSEEGKKERKKEEKKKTLVGIRTDYPREFDEAWKAYGRRGDKKAGYEVWKILALDPDGLANLMTAIVNYTKENQERKFRSHFHRFLKTDWRENLTVEREKRTGRDWSKLNLDGGGNGSKPF